jgi:Sugar (and other) transporter
MPHWASITTQGSLRGRYPGSSLLLHTAWIYLHPLAQLYCASAPWYWESIGTARHHQQQAVQAGKLLCQWDSQPSESQLLQRIAYGRQMTTVRRCQFRHVNRQDFWEPCAISSQGPFLAMLRSTSRTSPSLCKPCKPKNPEAAPCPARRPSRRRGSRRRPQITGDYGWRISLACAGLPAIMLTIGGIILPDTPNSLVERGRLEEGRAVILGMRISVHGC